MSHFFSLFFYKVLKIFGGRSVINEAYPVYFFYNDHDNGNYSDDIKDTPDDNKHD